MFGQSNAFGSGGGFGQNTAPAFGSPAPAPGGLFGSPAPAFGTPAPAPAFGSAFGAPASGGLFGNPAPAPTGFGAPGGFGSPSPAPFGAPPAGGGMFGGNPAPAFGSPAPGLFGAPAPATTPFGQPNTAPAFGAPAPSGFGASGGFGSSFGAPAPSGGLFGAPAPSPFGVPAPAAFGVPAPAPFGAPAPTGFGGAFGSTPAPAFGAPAPSFGAPAPAFGAPAPTFGAPAPAFGAPAPTFGAPAPAFGAPAPSFGGGFGAQPAPAPGGLFGAPAPSPSGGLFGAPPAPAVAQGGGTRAAPFQVTNRQDGQTAMNLHSITAMPQYENKSFEELRFEDYSQGNKGQANPTGGGFGGFGSPSPAPSTGLFGAPSPAPALGGFGSPAPAPFGAPAPSPFGAPAPSAFGAPAPAPGSFGSTGFGASGFGSPSPAPGFFGSTPAPAPFGAPSPAPGGFFGGSPAPAPFGSSGGGLFGSSPAPAPFGAPAPTGGGLFGAAPSPAPFGAPAPSTGLFGAPSGAGGFGATAPAPGGFGAFGAPAPAPGGFGAFGAPAPSFAPTMAQHAAVPANTFIVPQASNEVLAQQVRALVNERQELEKFDVWKGKSPSSGTRTTPTNQALSDSLSRPAYVPHIASTPTSGVKIRPRGFFEDTKSKTPSMTPMGRDNRAFMSPESYARSSALTLVVAPESEKKLTQRRPLRLTTGFPSPITATNEDIQLAPEDTSPRPPSSLRETAAQSLTKPATPSPGPQRRDPGEEYYNKLIGADSQHFSPPATGNKSVSSDSNLVPKLTKPGYEVCPSIEDMARMSEANLATVAGFSVKRAGVGMVAWEGAVDVRGADLDSIILIEPKLVEVYAIEEKQGTKPSVGSKLNRPAIITCYNVFPKAGRDASEEAKDIYAKNVAKNTKKIGAELIEYDKNSGVWKIRVRHFSRYALVDDESDDEGTASDSRNEFVQSKRDLDPKPMPLVTKQTRTTPQDLDLSSHSEDATMISDTDNLVESLADRYRIEADMVSQQIELSRAFDKTKVAENVHVVTFEDEGEGFLDDFQPVFAVSNPIASFQAARSSFSICNQTATKSNVSTSSIDMGMRMRSSFRVGWLPDGSFLQLNRGSTSAVLVTRRPAVGSSEQVAAAAKILSKHIIQTNVPGRSEEAPLYSLPGRDSATPQLLGAIHSLAAASSIHADVRHGMRMLSELLFFHSDSDSAIDRQVASAHNFMTSLCKPDVESDIMNGTKPVESVFAALSGADLDRSCELAGDAGCLNLLVALTVGNAERREFSRQFALLAEQGCTTKVELSAVRVMKALGLASDYEDLLQSQNKSTLNWRRRMALRLWQSQGKSLKEVIEAYEHDISLGNAPFPHPSHSTEGSRAQDMLYKLLKMCAGITTDGVCEVISPRGFSRDRHDYSHSFYLGLSICASCSMAKITTCNAERLIDGYVSQLIAEGQWIWAVFISLYVFVELNPAQQVLKRHRAKQIVLQHFDGADPFLQNFLLNEVGIPSSWVSEALAIRGLYKHDLNQLMQSTIAFDQKTTRVLLEELYLPELFFRNDMEEIMKAQKLIEEAAEGSLAATMHEYFGLEMQLSEPNQVGRHLSQLQHILASLSTVETALKVHRTMLKSNSVCKVLFPREPTSKNVSAMISTALETLNQRRLEIECSRRSTEFGAF